MAARPPEVVAGLAELARRREALMGPGEICARCGATAASIFEACAAGDEIEDCPGVMRWAEVLSAATEVKP